MRCRAVFQLAAELEIRIPVGRKDRLDAVDIRRAVPADVDVPAGRFALLCRLRECCDPVVATPLAEHARRRSAAGRDIGKDGRDRHGFVAETQIGGRIVDVAVRFSRDKDTEGNIAERYLGSVRKSCRLALQDHGSVDARPVCALVAQEKAGAIALDHAMHLRD